MQHRLGDTTVTLLNISASEGSAEELQAASCLVSCCFFFRFDSLPSSARPRSSVKIIGAGVCVCRLSDDSRCFFFRSVQCLIKCFFRERLPPFACHWSKLSCSCYDVLFPPFFILISGSAVSCFAIFFFKSAFENACDTKCSVHYVGLH